MLLSAYEPARGPRASLYQKKKKITKKVLADFSAQILFLLDCFKSNNRGFNIVCLMSAAVIDVVLGGAFLPLAALRGAFKNLQPNIRYAN